jgi:hypothetical protein
MVREGLPEAGKATISDASAAMLNRVDSNARRAFLRLLWCPCSLILRSPCWRSPNSIAITEGGGGTGNKRIQAFKGLFQELLREGFPRLR